MSEATTATSTAERARRMMRGSLLAEGRYAFMTEEGKTLPPTEGKNRVHVADAYPLNDATDANTKNHEFKQSIWIKLIGVEGWEPVGKERDEAVRTLQAFFPNRIPSLTKIEKGRWAIDGVEDKYEALVQQQLIAALDVAQELADGTLKVEADTLFYAVVKAGKNGDRVFVNYPSATNTDANGEEKALDVPSEFKPKN